MTKLVDMTGKVCGRLTVTSRGADLVSPNGRRRPRWHCVCQCGTKTLVDGNKLRSGNTKSCGCHIRDITAQRNYRHGKSVRGKRTPEYRAWCKIKERCIDPNNKDWHHYAGRGITICDEWLHDFQAFYDHVGPKPDPKLTIDRIDNNRGYEPGNVRWATRAEQAANRRPSSEWRKR